jgi:hypothetical protein
MFQARNAEVTRAPRGRNRYHLLGSSQLRELRPAASWSEEGRRQPSPSHIVPVEYCGDRCSMNLEPPRQLLDRRPLILPTKFAFRIVGSLHSALGCRSRGLQRIFKPAALKHEITQPTNPETPGSIPATLPRHLHRRACARHCQVLPRPHRTGRSADQRQHRNGPRRRHQIRIVEHHRRGSKTRAAFPGCPS